MKCLKRCHFVFLLYFIFLIFFLLVGETKRGKLWIFILTFLGRLIWVAGGQAAAMHTGVDTLDPVLSCFTGRCRAVQKVK